MTSGEGLGVPMPRTSVHLSPLFAGLLFLAASGPAVVQAGPLWTPTGPLNDARYHHATVVLTDGRVLTAGGYNGNYLASAELYDPATDTWKPAASMSVGREYS